MTSMLRGPWPTEHQLTRGIWAHDGCWLLGGEDLDGTEEAGGEGLGVELGALGVEAVAEFFADGFDVVVGEAGFVDEVDGGVGDFDAEGVFAGLEGGGEVELVGWAPGGADGFVVEGDDGDVEDGWGDGGGETVAAAVGGCGLGGAEGEGEGGVGEVFGEGEFLFVGGGAGEVLHSFEIGPVGEGGHGEGFGAAGGDGVEGDGPVGGEVDFGVGGGGVLRGGLREDARGPDDQGGAVGREGEVEGVVFGGEGVDLGGDEVPFFGAEVFGAEGGVEFLGFVGVVGDEVEFGGVGVAVDGGDVVVVDGDVGGEDFCQGGGEVGVAWDDDALGVGGEDVGHDGGEFFLVGVGGIEAGDDGGDFEGDDGAAGVGEGFEFAGGVEGHVGDGGEEDDFVVHVAEVEGGVVGGGGLGLEHAVVDGVGVVAGVEDLGEEGGLFHEGGVEAAEGGGGVGPDVGVGEVEGDVVGGGAFAQHGAGALDVGGDGGHSAGVPGVFVVDDGGGVEAGAGVGEGVGGVGPAVADDLVDAVDEVDVDFAFEVDGGGAEGGGVEPGEGFGGGDGDVHEVRGGGGVAGGAKIVEVKFGLELAFREVGFGVGEEAGGRGAVALDAEAGVVFVGEGLEAGVEVVGVEFGDGSAEVVADGVGFGADVSDEGGEVGGEVVAAAFLEFGEEVVGPVFALDFEGVAEDGVGGIVAAGFDFGFGDVGDEFVDDLGGKVVDDEAFGAVGGAFYFHAGAAGDEEGDGLGVGVGREGGGVLGEGDRFEGGDVGGGGAPAAGVGGFFGGGVAGEGGDDGVAGAELGEGDGRLVGFDGDGLGFDAAGAFVGGEHGAAVGPAAAEGEVHAEAEGFGFGGGVAEHVEEFGGHEFEDFGFVGGVGGEGVGGLEFDAAEAAGFDGGEFAVDALLGDGGAEPPPADHGAGVVGGGEEVLLELGEVGEGGGGEAGEGEGGCREEVARGGGGEVVEAGIRHGGSVGLGYSAA